MELFCPTCGRKYPASAGTICPEDGDTLIGFEEEEDLTGERLNGKYDIISKIGEGGMGTVYKARQISMNREVAIKVLKHEYAKNQLAKARFEREAKAASRLSHPNTIRVYERAVSDQGFLYQVIELLHGESLADIMDDEGAISLSRSINIMSQICDSLAEAHEFKVTHRDLKPENIFIEPKHGNPEFVKVLDFGIAKIAEPTVSLATATGMICGTPAYMSPEQAMGKPIDGRSDIYALGILLWEMLYVDRPYDGDTPMEIMLQHINGPVPELPTPHSPEVHLALSDLFAWVLAKAPDDRPQTCIELKERLLAIASGPLAREIALSDTQAAPTLDVPQSRPMPVVLEPQPANDLPEPARSWGAIAAAAVLGLLTALMVMTTGQDAPAQATSSQTSSTTLATRTTLASQNAPPIAPPVKDMEARAPIDATVSTTPPGAKAFNAAGEELGVTPFSLPLAPSDAIPIAIVLEGYESRMTTVRAGNPSTWAVTLKPTPKAKAPPADKPKQRTKPRDTPVKVDVPRSPSRKLKATKAKPPVKKPTVRTEKRGFGTF